MSDQLTVTPVVLEPAAQAFAEATADPPYLFDLGPIEGRKTVDEVNPVMRSRLKSLLRRTASSSRHPRRRALALLSIIVLIAALAAGCGGDSGGDDTAPAAAEWMTPNASYENTRVANSEIDSENVDDLNVTWTQPLTGSGSFGAFASTPLISEDGVAYVQDLASNVMAYDLETGEQLWKVEYDAPTLGPNGLAHEDGVLFGVTNGDVFALDAESGEEVWKEQVLEYDSGVAEGQNLGFTIQPAVRDGVLHLSEAAKAGGGRALAFDAKTGEQLWSFDTTDEPRGDDTPSGGAWNTPLVDDEGNVYYSVANGYYSHELTEEHAERTPLHEQSREARRRDRRAPLVLPGPAERLLGLGSAPLARARGLGRRGPRGDRREAGVRHRRRSGDRRGGLEDVGRDPQRPRRGQSQAAGRHSRALAPVRGLPRRVRRRRDEPGGPRGQGLRGGREPSGARERGRGSEPACARGRLRQRQGRARQARSGDGRDRLERRARHDAARRGHHLERSPVHDALRRAARRTFARGRLGGLVVQAACRDELTARNRRRQARHRRGLPTGRGAGAGARHLPAQRRASHASACRRRRRRTGHRRRQPKRAAAPSRSAWSKAPSASTRPSSAPRRAR